MKVVVAGWMIIAGAFALLLGSTMTWMTVRGPRVNDSTSASGMSIGDGRITVVLAIVLAVLGAGLLTGRLRKLGGTKVAAMGALVAGAAGVAVTAIDIPTVFANFDDYWSPFLGGQGPAPGYCANLPEADRAALRERIRASLPVNSDGSIPLTARAWAVRGTV